MLVGYLLRRNPHDLVVHARSIRLAAFLIDHDDLPLLFASTISIVDVSLLRKHESGYLYNEPELSTNIGAAGRDRDGRGVS